jgi:hypothetical protein
VISGDDVSRAGALACAALNAFHADSYHSRVADVMLLISYANRASSRPFACPATASRRSP